MRRQKLKTIKEVHKQIGEPATPTHIYDRWARKIYDVKTHWHLEKVRDDMAAGRPVWIPKEKKQVR
jgi:hypothetical protein